MAKGEATRETRKKVLPVVLNSDFCNFPAVKCRVWSFCCCFNWFCSFTLVSPLNHQLIPKVYHLTKRERAAGFGPAEWFFAPQSSLVPRWSSPNFVRNWSITWIQMRLDTFHLACRLTSRHGGALPLGEGTRRTIKVTTAFAPSVSNLPPLLLLLLAFEGLWKIPLWWAGGVCSAVGWFP